MKKSILFITISIIVMITSYPELTTGNVTGSPGGRSNSPIDASNCTACHNGNINIGPGNLSITSNVPQNGYIPGETYTITASITENNSNRFGFEMTSESNNGGINTKVGQWVITDAASTKKVNSDNAVTHKFNGTSGSGSKSWSIDWIAPGFAMSTGSVTFYTTAMAANGNGNNAGDNVYTAEYSIQEQSTSSLNNKLKESDLYYHDDMITILSDLIFRNIYIYNLNGRLVKIINSNTNQFNTSDLKRGVYFLKLTDENQLGYSRKINIY